MAEDVTKLPNIEADDVASVLYTSGTTGTPKSVPLTHRNFQSNVTAMVTENPLGAEDRILLPLPLHHAYPFTVGLLGAIASGATLVFPAGISGPQIANAIREAKATVLIGVPRLYTALVDGISNTVASHGAAAVTTFKYLLNFSIWLRRTTGKRIGRVLFRRLHARLGPDLRLLCSGGARLDPGLELKLEALGWQVLTGYGLTETAPILTINPPGKSRLDSAGLPVPGVELRCDGVGAEILVRGPNVFAGYRNNPEATRDAFTSDGWFRTGDLGFVDRDGYLHITGRAKEVIVLSDGKNVNPEDVETAYLEGAFIREFAVLEQDQALAALVVPDDDAVRKYGAAREEDLLREEIEAISRRLPSYKRVATYRVTRTRLPRNNLGKLRRHLLPNIYAAAVTGSDRVSELTEDDRRLLAVEPAKSVWHWLQIRFHGKHLTLETSPQFDLHVDSLEWVALTLEIQEHFGIALDEATIGRVVTLRDLLNEVCAAEHIAADQSANIGELTDEGSQMVKADRCPHDAVRYHPILDELVRNARDSSTPNQGCRKPAEQRAFRHYTKPRELFGFVGRLRCLGTSPNAANLLGWLGKIALPRSDSPTIKPCGAHPSHRSRSWAGERSCLRGGCHTTRGNIGLVSGRWSFTDRGAWKVSSWDRFAGSKYHPGNCPRAYRWHF